MSETRDFSKDFDERNRNSVSNMGWGQYQYDKREMLYKMNGFRINEAIQRSKIIEDANRKKYSFLIKKWDIYRERVIPIRYLIPYRNVN
jgi:hypothetical protein